MNALYKYFCVCCLSSPVRVDLFMHFSRLQSPSNFSISRISAYFFAGVFLAFQFTQTLSEGDRFLYVSRPFFRSLVLLLLLLVMLIHTASSFLGISLLWNWNEKEEAKICKIKTLSFVALSETNQNWKTSVVLWF